MFLAHLTGCFRMWLSSSGISSGNPELTGLVILPSLPLGCNGLFLSAFRKTTNYAARRGLQSGWKPSWRFEHSRPRLVVASVTSRVRFRLLSGFELPQTKAVQPLWIWVAALICAPTSKLLCKSVSRRGCLEGNYNVAYAIQAQPPACPQVSV